VELPSLYVGVTFSLCGSYLLFMWELPSLYVGVTFSLCGSYLLFMCASVSRDSSRETMRQRPKISANPGHLSGYLQGTCIPMTLVRYPAVQWINGNTVDARQYSWSLTVYRSLIQSVNESRIHRVIAPVLNGI